MSLNRTPFQIDNIRQLKLDDQTCVRDLLKAVRESITQYDRYIFCVSCKFLCDAELDTSDLEVEDFVSSQLKTTDGGVNKLHAEIRELAQQAKIDFCKFKVEKITNIEVTLIPKSPARYVYITFRLFE